jgi:hypothetical protein
MSAVSTIPLDLTKHTEIKYLLRLIGELKVNLSFQKIMKIYHVSICKSYSINLTQFHSRDMVNTREKNHFCQPIYSVDWELSQHSLFFYPPTAFLSSEFGGNKNVQRSTTQYMHANILYIYVCVYVYVCVIYNF